MTLVQFQPTKLLLIEGSFTRYIYTYNFKEQFDAWKVAASAFLAYAGGVDVLDKFKHIIYTYRSGWLNLIAEINGQPMIFNAQKLHSMTMPDIYASLNLPETNLKDNDSSMTKWGPRYWQFLHLTSIMVNRSQIRTNIFASFMYNFDIFLYCSICSRNYQNLDAMRTVTVPMMQSKDPITTIFNLHNSVNQHTTKPTFTIEAFCDSYNLQYNSSAVEEIHYSQPISI